MYFQKHACQNEAPFQLKTHSFPYENHGKLWNQNETKYRDGRSNGYYKFAIL